MVPLALTFASLLRNVSGCTEREGAKKKKKKNRMGFDEYRKILERVKEGEKRDEGAREQC